MWQSLILFLLLVIFDVPTNSQVAGTLQEIDQQKNHQKRSLFSNLFNLPTSKTVTVYENQTLVLNCSVGNYKTVKWYKFDAAIRFEKGVPSNNLIIPNVSINDTGRYACVNKKKNLKEEFSVIVLRKNSTSSPSTLNISKHDIKTFGFPITWKPPNTESPAEVLEFFECANGGRINKSLRCDYNNDCTDGSDEEKCEFFHPKIIVLPDLHVELFCGTDEIPASETLKLVCEFSGHPMPFVKWKRYDNHVPSKCQQISEGGRGTLLCHNFKQSDQGAYSCVGENSEGSGQSQPKTMVKCKNFINCKGFKTLDEDQMEHCLDCFCSGKSNQCENIQSKPLSTTLPLSDSKVEIFFKDNGEIAFIPSDSKLVPDIKVQDTAKPVTYCELSANDIKENSLLKSYGRKLRLPKQPTYNKKNKFLPEAPDLIVKGNDIPLLYYFDNIPTPMPFVEVKFWQGNWIHLNKTHATRRDIMTVLSDFESFLIRCEYKEGIIEDSKTKSITIESSSITHSPASPGYLEKCTCPLGYEGLSCESCAKGYEKIKTKNDFTCKLKSCNQTDGFYWDGTDCKKSFCNIHGSRSLKPDIFGKCECKENVIGRHCDQCANGYFNVQGCIKCYCSGVSNSCNSTTLKRTIISSTAIGGYNVSSNTVSSGKNFWLLPSIFTGNRLASYGGFIKYGMKYLPNIKKQTGILSVELLTGEDFTLTYSHPDIDISTSEDVKKWKVDLKENFWKKADGNFANRSEFLEVLVNLKAIYIESPYHLAHKMVNLTWVHMSDAKNISDPTSETAYEVEQCPCPSGYKGLSCEECADGYIKIKNTNFCMPCDPHKGCSDCPKGHFRSNPEFEKIPICKKCNCSGNEEKCGADINGKPYCICKSGYGGFNCENRLSVKDSHLIVRIRPSRINISQLGSMVTFNCSYDSSEEMKLSFTKVFAKEKKGPHIAPENPLNSVNSKFGSAMLWNTHLETDLVQIECNVNNLKGKEVGKVIAVVDKTESIQIPIKITNCYSNTITVKETKSQDLICTATGKPEPVINWFVKLSNGSLEKVESVDGVHSIENAKLEQNGTEFVCQAKNEIEDMQSCSFTLLVTKNCDKVHIVPKSLTLPENETISLKCTTTSNRTVSWSRLNSSLPVHKREEMGVLTITNAKPSDTGIYMCKMWLAGEYINDTANVTIIEKKIPPRALISKNDVNLNVGDNFEVSCAGDGKPIPTVSWLNNRLTSYSNVIIIGKSMRIQNATLLNSGIYECQANSSEGTHISRIYVNVTENRVQPKVAIEPNHLFPTEGTNLTLRCVIKQGIPRPTLYWSKYYKGKFSSIKPNGIVQENGSLLVFNNISRNDSGEYICIARNSVGQVESRKELQVMHKPEVYIHPEEFLAEENDNITVTCIATGYPKPTLTVENRKKSLKKRFASKVGKFAEMKATAEITVTTKAESDLEALICVASNVVGSARAEAKVILTASSEPIPENAIRVPLGSPHTIMCYNCSGKLRWEKTSFSKSKNLAGDECEIEDGLKIESVQIQHRGTYVCICNHEPKFRKENTLIVYGYAPRFVQKSKSYLIASTTFNSKEKLRLEICFKTNENNGVLLYQENHKFLVYIHNYKIGVALFSNNVANVFNSDRRLLNGTFYSLIIDITIPTVVMTIYDEESTVFEKKTEANFFNSKFDFDSSPENLFIGGTKHHVNARDHHLLPRHLLSLDGCITRLTINNHEFDIVKESNYSSMASLCKRCSSGEDPCKGEGKCLDAPTHSGFVCLCPEYSTIKDPDTCPRACKGRNCDGQLDLCELLKPCNESNSNGCAVRSLSSLECHCNVGYSGLTCNEEMQTSICFGGNGYAKLPSYLLHRLNLEEPQIISMEFYINEPSGLLLLQGEDDNMISISVFDGKLKYLFANQNTTLKIISKPIALKTMHQLKIKRSNGTALLTLDSETLKDNVKFTTDRVFGHIYLGGVPHNNFHYRKHAGLNGGIHSVAFGQNPTINFRESRIEIVNNKPCENTGLIKNDIDYEESGDLPYDWDV